MQFLRERYEEEIEINMILKFLINEKSFSDEEISDVMEILMKIDRYDNK